MPYITSDARKQLELGRKPIISGELNYVITKLAIELKDTPNNLRIHIKAVILEYLGERQSYTLFNEVMGVLECARLEYRRRLGFDVYVDDTFDSLEKWLYSYLITPYEDRKLIENGDVY